jgi:hypothetical protein
MTATVDNAVAALQRANVELQRQLDERTAELHEKNERYALVSEAVAEASTIGMLSRTPSSSRLG